MPNTCGTCTQCCTSMGVVELRKPAGVTCEHCDVGHGCRIYPERPSTCAGFKCAWLLSQEPEDLRPDSSHVLLVPSEDGGLIVAKTWAPHADACKAERVRHYLRHLVKSGIVVFIVVDEVLTEIHYSSEALTSRGIEPDLKELLSRIAGETEGNRK